MAGPDIVHKVLNILRNIQQTTLLQLTDFLPECLLFSLSVFNITDQLSVTVKKCFLQLNGTFCTVHLQKSCHPVILLLPCLHKLTAVPDLLPDTDCLLLYL